MSFAAAKSCIVLASLLPLISVAQESSAAPTGQAQSYQLAEQLDNANMPAAAALYYSDVIKSGPSQPFYFQAVQHLAAIQGELNDSFLIPTELSSVYNDRWHVLPAQTLARVRYLVALTSYRSGALDRAHDLLVSIPPNAPIAAKAYYLLGVVLTDPRYPGGPVPDQALQSFQRVLSLCDDQAGLAETQQLAILGIARTHYAAQRFPEAVSWYERIPRFSKYWDDALFEDGFARFRNGDFGGALGSLQALHAPQFESSFQPESWLLKATVYHFSCLYDESTMAMKTFEQLYLPMAENIRALAEASSSDYGSYYELISTPVGTKLPRAIDLWIRNNERIQSVLGVIKEMDREKSTAAHNPRLTSATQAELPQFLDQNRAVLVQTAGKLVKNRLVEAYQNIRRFSNDGDLIRLETTLAEKKLYELGVDRQKVLADQSLHQPVIPSEEWNHWKFDGEFWIDEIGYYQYTLKRGCPDYVGR